jgi:hypothetical protein
LCRKNSACCLTQADFAPARWTAAAGPYLRALREHYECMRGDTLIDVSLYEDDMLPPGRPSSVQPIERTLLFSCEHHACMESESRMAAQLDRALAQPASHELGASLVRRRETNPQ